MHGRSWTRWSSLIVAALVFGASSAHASYRARARWQPSPDASVTGYRLRARPAGGTALAVDAGLPVRAADGTLSATVPGLDPCAAYAFAVTAYHADGSESAASNEIILTAAAVAPLIDVDGDGLSNAAEDTNLDCIVGPAETDPNNPDTDGDGVGDARDRCGRTAGGAAVNADGCSCAEVTCGDGNACNGEETCLAGVCRAGTPPNCDDHNPCTADTCTAGGGCQHAPVAEGNPCSDGLFCNGAETCRRGVCAAGVAVSCDDANACTVDTCAEPQRTCTHVAIAGCCTADADCGSADACRTNVRCDAGRCVSDPVPCPDPGSCADPVCDPAAGCGTIPLPDGTACERPDLCTTNAVCMAGVCTAPITATVASERVDASTRLSARTGARGFILSAVARFTAPAGADPTAGDLDVVLRDGDGRVLYDATVPASRFARTGAAAVYREDGRDAGEASTVIELRQKGDRVSMRVRVWIPTPSDLTGAADSVRATDGSASVAWALRTGRTCVGGSGQCKGRGRRCR